jgi:hypothetical protein
VEVLTIVVFCGVEQYGKLLGEVPDEVALR